MRFHDLYSTAGRLKKVTGFGDVSAESRGPKEEGWRAHQGERLSERKVDSRSISLHTVWSQILVYLSLNLLLDALMYVSLCAFSA